MRIFITGIILLTFLSCGGNMGSPNKLTLDDIPVLNFDEFEPILNQNDDMIYVINFWATWCAPCVDELPYFQEIHDTYGTYNVKVVLVSLDFTDQLEDQLLPFLQKHEITASTIVLNDPNEQQWIDKVDSSWSGALPATIIYHKSQRLFYERKFNRSELIDELSKFVKI